MGARMALLVVMIVFLLVVPVPVSAQDSCAVELTQMAMALARASTAWEEEDAVMVVQTLEAERQGISGVSLDEEALHMITFQRAFQGAARYVNLIDQMLDEVMSLVD